MKKFSVIALIGVVLMGVQLQASRSDKEKLEKAIEAGKIDKVRSLLKNYESKNPSAQERKVLLQYLAKTASDVVENRKEKLSLGGNIRDILTYQEREKARDIGLMGIGAGLVALGVWYGQSAYAVKDGRAFRDLDADRWKNVTYYGGIATVGALFGGYALYKGFTCAMQNNALVAAQKIESFLQDLVTKNNA